MQGLPRPGPIAGNDIGARQVDIGRLVVGRYLDSIAESGDGVLRLLHPHVQYAEVINCAGMIRLVLDRLLEPLSRLFGAILSGKQESKLVGGFGIPRLDLERAPQ